MKQVSNKDLLIVARPDHSMQIYDALSKQSEITFTYVIFKVIPKWLKKIIRYRRAQSVGANAKISLRATLINYLKFNTRLKFARRLTEEGILSENCNRILKKTKYKIIYYWPYYIDERLLEYLEKNPDVKGIIDIHMPSYQSIYDTMVPIYEQNGIPFNKTDFINQIDWENSQVLKSDYAIVPSKYVARTFKCLFPDKNFIELPYGITPYNGYTPKRINEQKKILEFVYIGRISLEKGCDILFHYFQSKKHHKLHVYGNVVYGQESIFEEFKESEHIVLHGSIPKSTVQDNIKDYDVGVHMSRFDAYSLAVGEIIGCGIPVIVSENTGICDDVRDNGFGLVCKLTEESLEKCIKQIEIAEKYNTYANNIDDYINNRFVPYQKRIIDFFKILLQK